MSLTSFRGGTACDRMGSMLELFQAGL
jgi:hypothetical protein